MNAIKIIAMVGLLSLGACASKTPSRVADAATTPLSDLNIVRADIPEALAEARKNPYQMPSDQSCTTVLFEIRKLDEVLGADLDTPSTAGTPSLIERGVDVAEDSAVGAVQRTAQGLVPFRSWVRKLSGAERYSKRVSAAITAGSIRRAFLKGVGASQGCSWGAPNRVGRAHPPHPLG